MAWRKRSRLRKPAACFLSHWMRELMASAVAFVMPLRMAFIDAAVVQSRAPGDRGRPGRIVRAGSCASGFITQAYAERSSTKSVPTFHRPALSRNLVKAAGDAPPNSALYVKVSRRTHRRCVRRPIGGQGHRFLSRPHRRGKLDEVYCTKHCRRWLCAVQAEFVVDKPPCAASTISGAPIRNVQPVRCCPGRALAGGSLTAVMNASSSGREVGRAALQRVPIIANLTNTAITT